MKSFKAIFLLLAALLFWVACEDETPPELPALPTGINVKTLATGAGEVWVGTFNSGVYRLKNNAWTNFRESDGLIADNIVALEISSTGVVWVGTQKGISRFENGTWTKLTTDDGLFSNDVRSLFCDDENNLWIGTAHNRLIRYNGNTFKTFHVNPQSSGPSEMGHIHAISKGTDGRVWAGSCISGLSVLDGEQFTDNVNGLSVFVQAAACTPKGEIWIGQVSGAYRLAGDQWTGYTVEDGLPDNAVLDIAIDSKNRIWVATQMGISRLDGSKWQNYGMADGLLDDYIAAIACDDDGNVWVGSKSGLVVLRP